MSQGGVPGGGVVKLTKQIPSVECKFFDTSITIPGVASTWTQIDSNNILSGIVQGTGPQERVGRKIKVIGFVVRYPFTVSAGPYAFDLVRDKQCNGVAALPAQIYTSPAEYGSLPNPFEDTRFQYLKRVESYNPAQAFAGAAAPICNISFLKKVSFPVEYNNINSGTVVDLTSDNVQLWCCSPTGTITPQTRGFIRVLYTDA